MDIINRYVKKNRPIIVKEPTAGMGQAVYTEKFKRDDEDWLQTAVRVAKGNCSIHQSGDNDVQDLIRDIASGKTLMSGRHMQHADESHAYKSQHVYTNCSTAATSSMSFLLLLEGSGVGRSYDNDLMTLDFRDAEPFVFTIDKKHPNYKETKERFQEITSKYPAARHFLVDREEVLEEIDRYDYHLVGDSKEGLTKAVEKLEESALSSVEGKLICFDVSDVRRKNAPIKGMQNRPATGPVPFIEAFFMISQAISQALDEGWMTWKLTKVIDHHLAAYVVSGGARRSARIAVKYWKDEGIEDFINIKDEMKDEYGYSILWSANNSVGVDEEFYNSEEGEEIARLVTEAQYFHGTGEPGLINLHRLNFDKEALTKYKTLDYIKPNNGIYDYSESLLDHYKELTQVVINKKFPFIVNPCITEDTWILTDKGARQVSDLINKPFNALVNGKSYHSPTGFFSTGTKEVYELKTSRGYSLKATHNHKILLTNGSWVEVGDLSKGDKIQLGINKEVNSWGGEGKFSEGYLIGQMLGNGGHNPNKYHSYVRFWEHLDHFSALIGSYIKELPFNIRKDFSYEGVKSEDTIQFQTKALTLLGERYLTDSKELKREVELAGLDFYKGFISGLFDADGTVACNHEKGSSIRLSQSNINTLEVVQRMLSRVGVLSTIYKDRSLEGFKKLPDGKGGAKEYFCKSNHELHISRDSITQFDKVFTLKHLDKAQKVKNILAGYSRKPYKDRDFSEVISIEKIGNEEVFDCKVEEVHCFDANGIIAHNCGEIVLSILGGFCVIGDLALANLDDPKEALPIATRMAKALVRVNMLDSIYREEVLRTNRIGVGITGIHEFAYKFFGLTFYDLIDDQKSANFWQFLRDLSNNIVKEVDKFCDKWGLPKPHTVITIKPSGSVSKLYLLTEGAHLPSKLFLIRWVQFVADNPEVLKYIEAGYPVRDISYPQNTVIVGFPTKPFITEVIPLDKIVTASQVSVEDQFKYLIKLEDNWINGDHGRGNQVSYTLKYKKEDLSYDDYHEKIITWQQLVKTCSVLPEVKPEAYEYLPEEEVSYEYFQEVSAKIKPIEESLDIEHLMCEGGACPI